MLTVEQARQLLRENGLPEDVKDSRTIELFLRQCREGNTDAIRAYIALGIDLECHADISLETPLIKATEGANIDLIDLLIDAGADLENRDSPGDTALMTAVNWNHEEVLKHLLKRGASPDAADKYNRTPLGKCLREGKSGFMDILLQAGASPNVCAATKDAPIQEAIYNSHNSELKAFLKSGGDPNLKDDLAGDSLLILAIHHDNTEALKTLIAHQADLEQENHYGWTPWMIAEFQDKASLSKLLASKGAKKRDIKPIKQFLEAAKKDDGKALQKALQAGVDINVCDPLGHNALMNAAEENACKNIEFLLNAGIDRHRRDYSQNNALWHAASGNHEKAVSLLLEAGLDPTTPLDPQKDPTDLRDALYYAVEHNNLKMFETLVKAGAPLHPLGHLNSELNYGKHNDKVRTKMIALIGKKGGDLAMRSQFGEPLLLNLYYNVNQTLIDALLDAGLDVNITKTDVNETLLHQFCTYKSTPEGAKLALHLLQRGADLSITSRYGYNPLQAARSYKNTGCIKVIEDWLKRQFADAKAAHGIRSDKKLTPAFFEDFVKTQNYATLLEWIRWGKSDLVKGLLKAGLSPNPVGTHSEHPIDMATENGDLALVEVLLAHGADPNVSRAYGGTPLSNAAGKGQHEIVKRLLAAGANPNKTDDWGESSMQAAASNGDVEMLKLLHQAGGLVNPSPVGWSPLIRAAQSGHIEAAEWLLAHGADINTRNEFRQNALHLAITNDHNTLALLLIEKGSDLNYFDTEGDSPLLAVVKKGNEELIRAMLKAGADPHLRPPKGGDTAIKAAKHRKAIAALFSPYQKGKGKQPEEAPITPVDREHPLPELLRAIYNRDFDAFSALMQQGADIHACNYRGDTALMLAILHQHEEMFQRLLQAGANLETTNQHNDNAWSFAMVYGGEAWKQKLEDAGAKISMDNLNRQASMMMRIQDFQNALKSGDVSKLDKIITEKTIDINAFNAVERPLQMAISAHDEVIARLFLQRGADPTFASGYGQDAFQAAQTSGKKELQDLLNEVQHAQPPGEKTDLTSLEGKTVFVRGRFSGYMINALKDQLKAKGAKIASKWNANKVDLYVHGKGEEAYLDEANAQGIPVWNETQVSAFLDGTQLPATSQSGSKKTKATQTAKSTKATAASATTETEVTTTPEKAVNTAVAPTVTSESSADEEDTGLSSAALERRCKLAFMKKNVVLTGSFKNYGRKELKDLLTSWGAKVSSSVSSKTNILIAGSDSGSKVNQAIQSHVTIWSEGKLLELLEPSPLTKLQMFPNGRNLRQCNVLASGEIVLPSPPKCKAKLTLKWDKVEFKNHRAFGETWGMELHTRDFYVGQLLLDGEPLKPATSEPELYRYCRFTEAGSDYQWDSHDFGGREGFYCSWLVETLQKGKPPEWTSHHSSKHAWVLELKSEWQYGCVLAYESEEYIIDLDEKTIRWGHHYGPYDLDK